jgi:hypothetical protein
VIVMSGVCFLVQVGTGFSFTDDDRGFAQNQDDVGRDLYR